MKQIYRAEKEALKDSDESDDEQEEEECSCVAI